MRIRVSLCSPAAFRRMLPALVVAIAFAACGGSGATTPAATTTPNATSTPMAASETEAASQAGGPAVPGEHDTDRVIISKIGVDAPITVRQVGQDGQMPNPDGPDDIAFYQFDPAFWPRYGGGPGSGGNVVLAGHVDWGAQHGVGCKNNTVKPPCEAVLWDLARLKTGDVIELQVAGALFKYQVTGSESYAASFEGWSGVLTGGDQEKLTIITCSGSFNPATREYNSRLVVSGVRVS